MTRAALSALFLAGCASVPPGAAPLSVSQTLQRLDELNGSVVRVEGISRGCGAVGCALGGATGSERLAVAGNAALTNALRRSIGRKVILQGRIDSACVRGSTPKSPTTGLVACVGIATPLRDARVVAVR